MFNLLVTASLKNRLLVLAAAVVLVAYGSFVLPRLPVDVFPDLNRPTVVLITEAEGLAPQEVEQLDHLSDRDGHGRHAGRGAHPLGLRCRPVDRLRGVRLGNRDLPRQAAGGRAARDRAGPAAARRAAADGADLLHHGRDHAGCGHRAVGLADGAARDRRLRDPPADPDHPRRCPGHPDRRRGAPVPRHARSGDDEPARHLSRRHRNRHSPVRRQHRRRLRRSARARVSDPQHRPDEPPRGPAQPRGGHAPGPQHPAAAGRPGRVRRARQARRRGLHGRARRHRRHPEAADGRHHQPDAGRRGAARQHPEDPAPGRDRQQGAVPAGDLHRDVDRQRRARPAWKRRSWSPSCCSCS